jgi:hypothetical protein
MKNEDQSIFGRRRPIKIRTIIAATSAALALSMAGTVAAHDGAGTLIRTSRQPFPIS